MMYEQELARTALHRPLPVDPQSAQLGYLFPDAPNAPHDERTSRRLKVLGEVMTGGAAEQGAQNSALPAVMSFFGRFLCHDLLNGTDETLVAAVTANGDHRPLDRAQVAGSALNRRSGKIALDSLYADGTLATAFDRKFARCLRSATYPGKMRLAEVEDPTDPATASEAHPTLPDDRACDLLRLGAVLGETFSEDDLRAHGQIDEDIQRLFFDPQEAGAPGPLNRARALLGDPRNDETLLTAQFHVALLRLHNRIVDACPDPALRADPDALFAWAQQQTRWMVQWLTVNAYLPALCDEAILREIRLDEAPLYTAFHARMGGAGQQTLPLPLEFTAAAFRFGDAMWRQSYDWNAFFPVAGFGLLSHFTGAACPPMSSTGAEALPANWVADWDRLARVSADAPDRCARKIDCDLPFALSHLPGHMSDIPTGSAHRNLAAHHLQRGHVLNLPSAQWLVREIPNVTNRPLPFLNPSELSSRATGVALAANGLLQDTPLWFYILKEAEVIGNGNRLGPLGTTLVADTLIGLIVHDPDSYWHQPGSDDGRWQPADTVAPSGVVVNSFENLLRAALVL